MRPSAQVVLICSDRRNNYEVAQALRIQRSEIERSELSSLSKGVLMSCTAYHFASPHIRFPANEQITARVALALPPLVNSDPRRACHMLRVSASQLNIHVARGTAGKSWTP